MDVLDTAKSFLLGSSDQLAVAHQRRRRIAVKSVQAKNNQLLTPEPSMREKDAYSLSMRKYNLVDER